MMQPIVRVESLGKRYRLGATHAGSIRDLVNGAACRLLRRRTEGHAAVGNGSVAAAVRDFWALRDVSFEVHPGEVVGVIGRNGAGKSTLLKILSRITPPTAGRVELRGRVASLLEVGTGFHPELTGRENVFLNGTVLGMTRAEVARHFDSIVEFAGVEKFVDTPVKRYSSGMAVRLGFAVAAHLDPEILIVDEVLAVGDAEFQRRCLGKMQDVARSGRTVFFVSHNMASVRALTRRSVLLSRGRIEFDGETDEAVDLYAERNGSDSCGDADPTETDRPFSGLSRDLEFVRLRFDGTPSDLSTAQDRRAIEAVVRSNRAVPTLQFGLTLFRDDHVPVGSAFSPPLPSPEQGSTCAYRLALTDLPLAPGRYFFGVSVSDARTGGRTLLDSLSGVLSFTVEPTAADGAGWPAGWGPIRLRRPEVEIVPGGAEASQPAGATRR